MEQETTSTLKLLHKSLFVLLCGLLVANLFLLTVILPDYLSGKPDCYPNQHARLLMGNMGQILLCSSIAWSTAIWSTAIQIKTPNPSFRRLVPASILLALSLVVLFLKMRLR